MKKLLIFLALIVLFKTSSGQYFIPLFDTTTDTTFSCTNLLADTIHNYLYMGMRDSSADHAYIDAYRNNTITPVFSLWANGVYFKESCLTDSGYAVFLTGTNFDFYRVDSLAYQGCIYGFCSVTGVDAIVSRNDTIIYDDNIGAHDYIFGNTPAGISFQIGDATGGSGISDLEFYNGYLYASGTFTAMNGNPACKYICWWDGNNWHPLNNLNQLNVINFGVGSFLIYNNILYIWGGGLIWLMVFKLWILQATMELIG